MAMLVRSLANALFYAKKDFNLPLTLPYFTPAVSFENLWNKQYHGPNNISNEIEAIFNILNKWKGYGNVLRIARIYEAANSH